MELSTESLNQIVRLEIAAEAALNTMLSLINVVSPRGTPQGGLSDAYENLKMELEGVKKITEWA